MEKVLAHKVILDGIEYRLSILEIEDGGRRARVRPFAGEEADTAFVNGTIEARRDAHGIYRITKLKI
ncbi:MAG: hypothetical protein K2N16_06115 [Muribaculaceae bacterium]|nr:hypothetical protein [Muribaculaceae bacterium]